MSGEEQPGDSRVFLHEVVFLIERRSSVARSTGVSVKPGTPRNTPEQPRNTLEHPRNTPRTARNSPEQPGTAPEHPRNIP